MSQHFASPGEDAGEAPLNMPDDVLGVTDLCVDFETGAPETAGEDDLGVPRSYEIPDFDQDAKDLEAYQDAKRRFQRQQLASAQMTIELSYARKREQLQLEIKNSKAAEADLRANALLVTRQYATECPKHVDKNGVRPPTLLDNMLTFGLAGRLHRAALDAAEALEALRAEIRKREDQLAENDEHCKREIARKEEALKKFLETESGLAEFGDRPEFKAYYARAETIRAERAGFARRLERGAVSDEELRDRTIRELKLPPTELPVLGGIIAKVLRFGRLSYFLLRDLAQKESHLSYDPRLDALRNCVFDIYSVRGSVTAKLRRNDNGTAFRVLRHFKASTRKSDAAEELYAQHRAALRHDRGLPAVQPRNPAEAEIIERLAELSAHVSSLIEGGNPVPEPASPGDFVAQ